MAESEPITGQEAATEIGKQDKFAGDVLKLVGGTTFAQALSVVIAPVLSRLYAPDAFGTAAVFTSMAGLITVVACLRYELAIMLPEHDEDAANLLAVSLGSALAIAGLSALLVLAGGRLIARLLKAPHLVSYLWLVPLAVLADGMFLGLNYWNSRSKRFGRLSVARIAQSVAKNGGQLGAGALGQAGPGGLITAQVLGSAVVTTVLGTRIWLDDRHMFLQNVRRSRMVALAKRHRKFPVYNTWSALLNFASWQLPTFLLAAFFSQTVVGYYALGNRMLQLPMSLVGTAVAQVFYQRASEAKNTDGDLATVVLPLFRRLVAFGLFPMLLLAVIGQDVFTTVFGTPWSEAGVYAQILSLWMFVQFISSPMSTLFSVLERQEGALLLNALIFASRFVTLGIGGLLGNARLALALFAASGIFVYGGLSSWILRTSGVSLSQSLRILAKYAGLSALFVSPAALVKLLMPAHTLAALVAGAIAFVVYGLVIARQEHGVLPWITRLIHGTH